MSTAIFQMPMSTQDKRSLNDFERRLQLSPCVFANAFGFTQRTVQIDLFEAIAFTGEHHTVGHIVVNHLEQRSTKDLAQVGKEAGI